MKREEMELDRLLEIDPDGGILRFAGQRALLLDAVAMGMLRKYLIENFGVTAGLTVLTQFGFAQGWRLAEAVKDEFTWETPEQRRLAWLRISTLQGLFRADLAKASGSGTDSAMVVASHEAEQHLMHFGRSDTPVCSTLCGLASGYLSHCQGENIYVLEDRCVGKGDAACHLVGRTREAWGTDRVDELVHYESGRLQASLETSLQSVTQTLKDAEKRLVQRRRALARLPGVGLDHRGIVARSAKMQQVIDLACRVAKVDATVLITGDSGVGKERIARLVHDESTRATGPFVAVNCGAITETLLESELFGHARGAFTGASNDRPGLFEAAHNGTLLLDEVGEVSPALQVKLLRVLQEREIRRVGENRTRRVDVRVLAATNRDLAAGIEDGSFRQDLYYRLKVVELNVPALRDRTVDILPLARVLLANAASRVRRRVDGIAPEVADLLLRYTWPGNVRELENAMERAVALARGSRVELDDLPDEIRFAKASPAVTGGAVRPLQDIEKDYILAALALNGGNQTQTAKQLQIGSATLYRKLKAWRDTGEPTEADAGP